MAMPALGMAVTRALAVRSRAAADPGNATTMSNMNQGEFQFSAIEQWIDTTTRTTSNRQTIQLPYNTYLLGSSFFQVV